MDDDKTPTDGKTTMELVFIRLTDLSKDVKQALHESREANLMSCQNNEILRTLAPRPSFHLLRSSAPYLALLVAVVALLRAW